MTGDHGRVGMVAVRQLEQVGEQGKQAGICASKQSHNLTASFSARALDGNPPIRAHATHLCHLRCRTWAEIA